MNISVFQTTIGTLCARAVALPSGLLQRYLPKSDVSRGLVISASFHAVIIIGILIALWISRLENPLPNPPEESLVTFNLPGVKNELEKKEEIPVPLETSDEKPAEESVITPPEPANILPEEAAKDIPLPKPSKIEPLDDQLVSAPPPGSADGDQLVWTPPPPEVLRSFAGAEKSDGTRVNLKGIDLPEGASDPILLSFDQARIDEAAELTEAVRLNGRGAMKMSVSVGTDGNPASCDVTQTTGSKLLDDRGCALVMSYFYRPAKDRGGNSRTALVFETLEWTKEANGQAAGLIVPGAKK